MASSYSLNIGEKVYVYVGTSDFGFLAQNFRILKFCLMNYYVDKNL
jgi:hypothetical protein